MLRTIITTERSLQDSKLPPVNLDAGVAADVLADSRSEEGEIAYIELFNEGPTEAYFAYGRDCDNIQNWNGILQSKQALNVITRERVSMFSTDRIRIGRTVFKRVDLSAHGAV